MDNYFEPNVTQLKTSQERSPQAGFYWQSTYVRTQFLKSYNTASHDCSILSLQATEICVSHPQCAILPLRKS